MTIDLARPPDAGAAEARITERRRSPAAVEDRIFFVMALVCVAIAFVGFVPTFWRPLAQGTFHAHPIVYIHGALFTGWTILLAVQAGLVARRRLGFHRTLGTAGIAVATLVATSGFLVLMNVVATVQAAGVLEAVAPDLFFPVIGFPTFAWLATLGFVHMHRADYHKRYMMLATISTLDAPVVRWILFEGHTSPGYAEGMVSTLVFDVMLAALAVFDWRTRGHVHRVYYVGAAILVTGQLLRWFVAPSAWWASAIHVLPQLLGE